MDRKEAECREFCSVRGWAVGEIFTDNDLSATKASVVRPSFERLLVSNPEVIVCWHSDRSLRRSKELERVIDLGVNIHAIHTGHLNLSTPAGRAVARTVTAWAQYEGEQKSPREKSSNRQRAKMGKPAWASRPPLGYTSAAEVVPEEAAAIRRAYDEVLGGRSMYAIANEWNANGPHARRSGRWTGVNLQRVLLTPRNAGISNYLGEEVGPGNWEPIVSEEVFRGVEALLKPRAAQVAT